MDRAPDRHVELRLALSRATDWPALADVLDTADRDHQAGLLRACVVEQLAARACVLARTLPEHPPDPRLPLVAAGPAGVPWTSDELAAGEFVWTDDPQPPLAHGG